MKEKVEIILKAVTNAFDAFKSGFKTGITSDELFKPFLKSLHDDLGEYEILYDYIWGEDSLNIDGVSKGYIPKTGDTVIMDISVGKGGVWCDICRTFFVGKASDEQAHVFELIKQSIKMGEEKLKAGTSADEIYKAVNLAYEADGKVLVHHAGHKIGKSALMEPRFVSGNSAKIEASNIYTIESGFYEKFGIRLENDYFVSHDKTENLFEKYMSLDIREYELNEKES